MSTIRRRGNNWTVEIAGDVMIWEFLAGMELLAFREEAYPVYDDLLKSHDINGMVTVVQLDDPFNEGVFELWEQSAKRAEQAGIERWAIVADGIKAISLRGQVDTGGLDTLTTESRTEAVEWTRDSKSNQ